MNKFSFQLFIVLIFISVTIFHNANAVTGRSSCEDLGLTSQELDTIVQNTVKVVIVDRGERFHCTGTLIGPDEILSAGHCFYDRKTKKKRLLSRNSYIQFFPPSTLNSLLARPMLDLSRTNMPLEKIVKIKSVSSVNAIRGANTADMAILKLDGPTGLTTTNIPRVYPGKGCDANSEYIQVGYGPRFFRGCAKYKHMTEEEIKAANITYIPNKPSWLYLNPLTPSVSERGDSGGPIYCKSNGIISLAGILTQGSDSYSIGMKIETLSNLVGNGLLRPPSFNPIAPTAEEPHR